MEGIPNRAQKTSYAHHPAFACEGWSSDTRHANALRETHTNQSAAGAEPRAARNIGGREELTAFYPGRAGSAMRSHFAPRFLERGRL